MKNKYECERKKCSGCQELDKCKVRGYEWLKGINTILSNHRGPMEGKKIANELINFMQKEFYGGI